MLPLQRDNFIAQVAKNRAAVPVGTLTLEISTIQSHHDDQRLTISIFRAIQKNAFLGHSMFSCKEHTRGAIAVRLPLAESRCSSQPQEMKLLPGIHEIIQR